MRSALAEKAIEYFRQKGYEISWSWLDVWQEAQAQAKASGEARLAELNQGEDKLSWSASRSASRLQARQLQLPPAALQAIFKADTQKLPAYVGSELGGSYMIYKVVKATQPEKLDEAKRKSLKDEYTTIVAQQDVAAYMSSLRQRYKIEINTGLLENRERQ